jgi:hypothetical protein
MIHHWRYLMYVLRHKYYVFVAGRHLGAPLLSLIIHDFSKFGPTEWRPYVNSFYRYKDDRPQWVKEDFDKAWLHHQHHNPHHWQHWVLQKDNGSVKILKMPVPYVREMVADWCGAGRAITGKWEVAEWYEKAKDKMQLDEYTRIHVEDLIRRASSL